MVKALLKKNTISGIFIAEFFPLEIEVMVTTYVVKRRNWSESTWSVATVATPMWSFPFRQFQSCLQKTIKPLLNEISILYANHSTMSFQRIVSGELNERASEYNYQASWLRIILKWRENYTARFKYKPLLSNVSHTRA